MLSNPPKKSTSLPADTVDKPLPMLSDFCPFCFSKDFVKRGVRQRKHSVAQLYLCRNPQCGKTFTAEAVKGKRFPLEAVIEGMSYYNLGFTFEESCALLKKKFGLSPAPATLSEWVEEYKPLCRFERLRPYAVKLFHPRDMVETVTMAHRQLYRFRYHRAKIRLMLEEFRNRNLFPLKEYLDSVSSVTPHQYFAEGERMSDIRSRFDKAEMIVKSKNNFANRLAGFLLSAVRENKRRHEELQRFFLANDSVTVATEVPFHPMTTSLTLPDGSASYQGWVFAYVNLGQADFSSKLTITADGNVGLGITTPAYKLHVIGDVAATSFVNISTKTSKKDITYLNSSDEQSILSKIKNVNVATYNYKFEECGSHPEGTEGSNEILRGVYTERSERAQNDGGVVQNDPSTPPATGQASSGNNIATTTTETATSTSP